MNEKIAELLVEKKLLLKKFQTIEAKNFTKLRSYEIFFGVDLQNFNTLIFVKNAKTRFISKDALALLDLISSAENFLGKVVKKRILFLKSEICSKSLKILKENGIVVYDFV